ncbi:MAG: hypothetical protein A2023_04110 [Sulfuricurvum sp. GWF2_44_89]|uniref:Transcobalamin-like C-terminal domain-containing protein n=1 Tax=Sulfuricurvum kujiense TaxID=148813 RepID=A0A2D3WDT2_9BACT|nr:MULTISPECIES: DUF4430 domain-containing protein [Sulfuricurvum]OHD77639.1 MAG: hypothetical protein A2023_04110 [Sulfuricurvum sp. GWF2_44_89]OHD92423.1 MAG: hypothetical protein A2517_10900 [Sulfuricurvum sp. RIFOXYD12_FULL_44_77]DAB39452.1 MAG TPA: hypothetical protein CFH83_00650 [Sulfuricurvum kujiense]
MKLIVLSVLLALHCWGENLTVTLHYGDAKPDKVIETAYSPGMSALDVLKRISRVETSKTGQYRFVRSIDGVQSQIGKFGWFYLIDGESVHTTAENFILNDAQTMTWIYKVEACY